MDPKKNEYRELIVNTMIFGMGTFFSKIIVFILLPVYTAYLTAAELGVGELVVNFMNLLFPLASVHMLSALLRFGMDPKLQREEVLMNTVLTIIVGVLIVGAGVTLLSLDSSINDWKGYLILLLGCYSFYQILSVFSKAIDNTKECAIASIVYSFFLLVSNIILVVFLHRGTAGYLESIIASNFLTGLYLFKKLHIQRYLRFSRPNFILMREMLWFSIPLIVNSVSWWLLSFCDRFILERYVGQDAVGLFSVASKFPVLFSTVGGIFLQAWALSAIRSYDKGGDRSFYAMVFRKFWVLLFSLSAIFICIFKPFLPLLVKGEFMNCWSLVPLLVASSAIWNVGGFYANLYTATKNNIYVMITTMAGAIVNILFNIILIPRMGIQGAVLATFVSQTFVTVYRMFDSRRFVVFEVNYYRYSISFLLLLVECFLLISGQYYFWVVITTLLMLIINYSEIQSLMRACFIAISKVTDRLTHR